MMQGSKARASGSMSLTAKARPASAVAYITDPRGARIELVERAPLYQTSLRKRDRRVCARCAARQFIDSLDVAGQISAFTKLKLANCAPISGLPEIGLILCDIDSRRKFLPLGVTA